jgi:hypothetical protein
VSYHRVSPVPSNAPDTPGLRNRGGIIDSVLGPIITLVALEERSLQTQPADHETWPQLRLDISAVRKGLSQGLMAVNGQAGLLQLELHRGRLSPADLKRVVDSVKLLSGRALSQGCFHVRLPKTGRLDAILNFSSFL